MWYKICKLLIQWAHRNTWTWHFAFWLLDWIFNFSFSFSLLSKEKDIMIAEITDGDKLLLSPQLTYCFPVNNHDDNNGIAGGTESNHHHGDDHQSVLDYCKTSIPKVYIIDNQQLRKKLNVIVYIPYPRVLRLRQCRSLTNKNRNKKNKDNHDQLHDFYLLYHHTIGG